MMVIAIVVLFLQQVQAVPAQPPARTETNRQAPGDRAPGEKGKGNKFKSYTFTGLDVEGKLKTPELLYFLNRVKLELETSAPSRRSFMKELERSADDKNL